MRRLRRFVAGGGRLLAVDETTLRLLPPLRAAWARRGTQASVPISGQNARRTLFGALDLRSGRRVLAARRHQRQADWLLFLRRLRAGGARRGPLGLLLDRHGAHTSRAGLALAAALNITLFWLPPRTPKLNPVDHLWRGLKGELAANRQAPDADALAHGAEAWVRRLSPTQTLRRAGLLSRRCWLRWACGNLRPST